jgi:Poly-beta-hydroxybutyrate polymerase N terminal
MAAAADQTGSIGVARQATCGLSHTSIGLPFLDWGLHLAITPFRRVELATGVAKVGGQAAVAQWPLDRRFRDPLWQEAPP